MQRLIAWLVIGLLPVFSATVFAAGGALDGEKEIFLQDRSGKEINIGWIEFTPLNAVDSEFKLHLDHSLFKDYFLSMKEMKCLEGPELWCAIPYPYQQPRTVSLESLRWLEHDLLFMFKKLDSFGANFWNGIYYQLAIEQEQIVGKARALDLNMLASPPDDMNAPPIGEFDIDDADLDQRWLPYIVIR
ncbi:hypothetical protein [Amphritea sp. HPY]|uniref:hypothetical protein n=1 Tax=Amphritea sp. HPY TaxID=3421652 RepID=UPI003D7D709A